MDRGWIFSSYSAVFACSLYISFFIGLANLADVRNAALGVAEQGEEAFYFRNLANIVVFFCVLSPIVRNLSLFPAKESNEAGLMRRLIFINTAMVVVTLVLVFF